VPSGYLLKHIESQELIKAIEAVGRGQAVLDPQLIHPLFNRVRQAEQSRGSPFCAVEPERVTCFGSLGQWANEQRNGTIPPVFRWDGTLLRF
jgi:hypothetical protein